MVEELEERRLALRFIKEEGRIWIWDVEWYTRKETTHMMKIRSKGKRNRK